MKIKHSYEAFADCCIEYAYRGHTFTNCLFKGCYLEVDGAEFVNCNFIECYIYVENDAFVGCDFSKSIPLAS